MNRTSASRCAAALAILLLASTQARADLIAWTDFSLATPHTVWADHPDRGHITLTGDKHPNSLSGSSTIVLANLRTFSEASATNPAHFSDAPFSLVVFVYDKQSHILGAATFSGTLEGTLSEHSANLSMDFTSSRTETLHLGHHLYTITLNPFAPPGPPDSSGMGSITASVTVTHNPEPSSLVLAALGLPLLGTTLWRRGRSRKSTLTPA